MPRLELVREVDTYRQKMTIDVFQWSGSSQDAAGWKVRVSAYDGKSPMPSLFELVPGGKNEKGTLPIYEATVAKMRKEGWLDELPSDAQARIDARVAREEAAEQEREKDLARRSKAFPASKVDAVLAAAIANPNAVRELDLRPRGGEKLTVIPKTVKKLAALEVLRIEGNGLPELPDELSGCKALRELRAANNAITDVPAGVRVQLKNLELLDLRNNRLESMYARSKVPMRLELGGNALEPAVQDLLTRSSIGDFRKISHVSIDTDCMFPIDLSYFEVDFPGVKALPTESVVLYGRAPTDEERATLAKLLPKAKIEHRASVTLDGAAPPAAATAAATASASASASGKTEKKADTELETKPQEEKAREKKRAPAKLEKEQAAHMTKLLAQGKKLGLAAKDVERWARPCIELFTKAASKAASKVGASRLGGAPDMPADTKWPQGAGGPMTFVAQLDCADLAPFDSAKLLPDEGMLAFFAGGYDEGAVLHFAGGQKLAPRALPKGAKFSAEKAVVAPACAVALRGAVSVPGYEQVEDVDTDAWHELWESSIREKDGVAPHRVLGHTLNDVESPPEGDVALFAVRSDENANMEWGDAGTLYFMLDEESLRARKWSDVEVVSTN
jgi:hypothetical protein